jgi:hypothetical protein
MSPGKSLLHTQLSVNSTGLQILHNLQFRTDSLPLTALCVQECLTFRAQDA